MVLYVHFCTPEAGQSETPPQPSHQCLPSKRMTRIPATHHCWTVDHPMSLATFPWDNLTPSAQLQWGQFSFPFSNGRSHPPIHRLLTTISFCHLRNRMYFLPGVLPGSFFHVRTVLPCSLTEWGKERTPNTSSPFIFLWHRKSSSHLGSYNWPWPQPPACGSRPEFQFSDLQIS